MPSSVQSCSVFILISYYLTFGLMMWAVLLAKFRSVLTILFIAPTSRAMRLVLRTCGSFADNFYIVFNAKNQCLIFEPTCKAGSFVNPKLVFFLGGNAIEIVNNLPQPGHIIDNRSDDGAAISFSRNSMVGHINGVLWFNQVGAVPKLKLLKSHCSSHYSRELWNLFHAAISDVCIL